MDNSLNNMRVAILVDNGYEQIELTKPLEALKNAGANAEVVSPQDDKVKGWDRKDWGEERKVDRKLDDANPGDYDALVLPGGVMNPDHLRKNEKAVKFVKHFFEQDKPVAAICHGPWTIIETGAANGRKMTSYESIQTDLKNAGANWVNEEVVVDGNLITSRKPDDIPAFCKTMVEEFSKVHA